MKPVVYSQKAKEEKNIGWYRAGDNITYFQNGLIKSARINRPLYTLCFSYKFNYSDDYVWFAYNYPYTYSQLMEFLNNIEADRSTTE